MQNYSLQGDAFCFLGDQKHRFCSFILAFCQKGQRLPRRLFIFPRSHPDKAVGCVSSQTRHLLQITETCKQEIASGPAIQMFEKSIHGEIRAPLEPTKSPAPSEISLLNNMYHWRMNSFARMWVLWFCVDSVVSTMEPVSKRGWFLLIKILFSANLWTNASQIMKKLKVVSKKEK